MTGLKVLFWLALSYNALYFLAQRWWYVRYPYFFDSQASSLLYHAWELAHGRPIYRDPREHPANDYLYPPLFQWLLSRVPGYRARPMTTAQLYSTFWGILLGVLAGLASYRLTGSPYWSCAAAFLLYAFNPSLDYSIGWPRVDSMMLCFALGALLAAELGHVSIAVILTALAFLTKQTGVFILPAVAAALWRRSSTEAGAYVAATAALCAAAFWLVDRKAEGRFSFYTVKLPRAYPFRPANVLFARAFVAKNPLLLAAACGGLAAAFHRGPASFYGLAAAALCSAVQLMKWGGSAPSLFPLAVFAIPWIAAALQRLEAAPGLLAALAVIQQIPLFGRFYKVPADPEAGRRLAERVRAQEGKVWFDRCNMLPAELGLRVYDDLDALDVFSFGGPLEPGGYSLLRQIEAKEFSLIVSDRGYAAQLARTMERFHTPLAQVIEAVSKNYRPIEEIVIEPGAMVLTLLVPN